jgi:hypothetical protein
MDKTDILYCDCCKNIIPHGQAYVALTRNIEYLVHDIPSGTDEIQIIDSDQFYSLCAICGNNFDVNRLKELLISLNLTNINPKEN